MKKRTIIAAVLLVSMLVGCSSADKKRTVRHDDEDAEETTEVTEETTVPSPTATPKPTAKPTPKPTPKPTEPAAEEEKPTYEESYDLLMDYAKELSETDSDVRFCFDDHSAKLFAVYPDDFSECYMVKNHEVVRDTENCYSAYEDLMGYEDFSKLPMFIDAESANLWVDEIDDGYYFGIIQGINEAGDMMIVTVGVPITYTEEEIRSMNVGDIIGQDYGRDVEVTEIEEEDGEWRIECSQDCFVNHGYSDFFTDYLLMEVDSGNPVRTDLRTVMIPIASDCEITDTFDILYQELEGYDEYLEEHKDDNNLHKSFFWFSRFEVEFEKNMMENGKVHEWYRSGCLLYPIYVENGVVTKMNIEWR